MENETDQATDEDESGQLNNDEIENETDQATDESGQLNNVDGIQETNFQQNT